MHVIIDGNEILTLCFAARIVLKTHLISSCPLFSSWPLLFIARGLMQY